MTAKLGIKSRCIAAGLAAAIGLIVIAYRGICFVIKMAVAALVFVVIHLIAR